MSKLILTGYEEIGDKQVATHTQDCTAILESCKEDRKNSDENWNKADSDIKAVGKIPLSVWFRLCQLGINDNADEVLKFLERNPQYKRTEKRLI